jgi:hypothetical protein
VIEKCPFHKAKERAVLIIDKSKNKKEIKEFNGYLLLHIEGILPLNIPLEIYHLSSHENKGIQAVDLFCWGIFRKFEKKDISWYQIFREKIVAESIYIHLLKIKKFVNPKRQPLQIILPTLWKGTLAEPFRTYSQTQS